MEKYLVQIEFRYNAMTVHNSEPEIGRVNYTHTIGIFEDFDSACNAGNNFLEEQLESRYKRIAGSSLHNRFSRDGLFGSRTTLITNLGYLRTPFEFFAKIQTLKTWDAASVITEIEMSGAECIAFKKREELLG
jgi:hypothetical protein